MGDAESSIERSLPFVFDSNNARRLRFTGAPVVSACFTGSLSKRRSVSSTSPMTSSSILPMALPASTPMRFSAAEFA
jgi:hypothetical protein